MGKYEVTQEQWEAVMGSNPSRFKANRNPVEQVSWNACQEFVKKLTAVSKEKEPFRLPTEAEWEYACRAGSAGKYCFGDAENLMTDYAWHVGNAANTVHPVGEKKPNAWGLYDMHGNVWEWCQDWYGAYADGEQTDPAGPAAGLHRTLRGGSWTLHFRSPGSHIEHVIRFSGRPGRRGGFIISSSCHSALRQKNAPGGQDGECGFRVVLSAGAVLGN